MNQTIILEGKAYNKKSKLFYLAYRIIFCANGLLTALVGKPCIYRKDIREIRLTPYMSTV